MKNNVFWLLFGSTAVGLSLCALALYFIILFAMAQDQILDFVEDVQTVRDDIEDHCLDSTRLTSERLTFLKTCIQSFSHHHSFDIQLSQQEFSPQEEYIGRIAGQALYELENEQTREAGFQASMPLQHHGNNSGYWVLIKDNLDIENSLLEEGDDELDIALMGAIYGTVILLIILALFIYFPVRKLNRWIGDIQCASEQIAQQNYDVRLMQFTTQPLAGLASSFNAMAEKIQDHIRDKNVLANAIAHELRTPLTRFRLALGLLNRQPLEGLSKELISDLERYTDELERITANTLRLATLRDSKINLQTIHVEKLIANQSEKFSASFPQLILTSSSQACSLNTDVGFLQLALDNLLSNACHYAATQVELRQWQEKGRVIIEVCDDGPGIPEQDIEYIQQAFTRLDKSRTRATGGAGLGLAIVRLAVQRLAGELNFQSSHSGTCIRLSVPLQGNDVKPTSDR